MTCLRMVTNPYPMPGLGARSVKQMGSGFRGTATLISQTDAQSSATVSADAMDHGSARQRDQGISARKRKADANHARSRRRRILKV